MNPWDAWDDHGQVKPKSVDLSTHAGACAFVVEIESLTHPAPVGPYDDANVMMAHALALAEATRHLRSALLSLHARWVQEGNFRAEALEWVLVLQD